MKPCLLTNYAEHSFFCNYLPILVVSIVSGRVRQSQRSQLHLLPHPTVMSLHTDTHWTTPLLHCIKVRFYSTEGPQHFQT